MRENRPSQTAIGVAHLRAACDSTSCSVPDPIRDADDARARYFSAPDALPAPRRSSLAFAVR